MNEFLLLAVVILYVAISYRPGNHKTRAAASPDYSRSEENVEHCVIEGRARKSEGIETNCCDAV
jgi:hypothetical protein